MSLFLNFRNPVCNAKRFQYFGRRVSHVPRFVTGAAVLRDGLPACSDVRPVMAPETPWIVGVTKIVWISAPRHFQIRKYIAVVDRQNGLTCLADIARPLHIKVWVLLLIKTTESCWKFLGCFLAATVVCFQHLHAHLLDEWQVDSNLAERKGSVHRALWQLERVRRTVVTVDALHLVVRESLRRLCP